MERTKSIPQQQAWVNTHKKRIIKHLDQRKRFADPLVRGMTGACKAYLG